MRKIQIVIAIFVAAICMLIATPTFAGNAAGGGKNNDSPGLPINKGLVFLVVAGAALGIYVVRNLGKKARV